MGLRRIQEKNPNIWTVEVFEELYCKGKESK
jgi:hypothetical protein